MFKPEELQIISSTPAIAPRIRTILDIADMPHYENVISNFYAYFLRPEEDHGLKNLFLDTLQDILNDKDFLNSNIVVTREESTQDDKRIDLLIRDDLGKCIIIENKIYHVLNNPLATYWSHAGGKDEEKRGVVLSLRKETIEKDWQNRFTAITHKEWIDAIVAKVDYKALDERQRILFQDFIQNIRNLIRDQIMNDPAKAYFENRQTMAKAHNAALEAREYILNQLDQLAALLGMEITRRSPHDARYRQIWHKGKDEIYFTILYESLWKIDGSANGDDVAISVIIEINKSAFADLKKFDSVLSFLSGEVKKGDHNGNDWMHFIARDFQVPVNQLSNLAPYLKEKIDEELMKYFDLMLKIHYPG